MEYVNVIGAGLAGLSAAVELAKNNIHVRLISAQPSERAQSVLAEGGINAALNTMGEGDDESQHLRDTLKGGGDIESEDRVAGLVKAAPGIVRGLADLGVPFQKRNGDIALRNFGGQKKKRTAFVKSSTGKMMMSALIDEVRKYEAEGLIERYPNHILVDMSVKEGILESVTVVDVYSLKAWHVTGRTILCTGGLNGFFEGMTTGTTANTGSCAAIAYCAGVLFSDLEFIQYHPTTVAICDKRMLVSEAARGEGGRLFAGKDGRNRYFMEEDFPELGNLSPRDVISREMYKAIKDGWKTYLDMRGLDEEAWSRLTDLRAEIMEYMGIDPKTEPVPVSPGIHFFMGGISVDKFHRTSVKGLYAAGEAASIYHGANRLGGNSMLGAIYGGMTAARTAVDSPCPSQMTQIEYDGQLPKPETFSALSEALLSGLGIIRNEEEIEAALKRVKALISSGSGIEQKRARLGQAMLEASLARRESRGAHTRTDYPEKREEFAMLSIERVTPSGCEVSFVRAQDVDYGEGTA